LDGCHCDLNEAFFIPQMILGNTFANQIRKSMGKKIGFNNLITRCLLSAGEAILSLYFNLGQVIPFGKFLKDKFPHLYKILLPGAPFSEKKALVTGSAKMAYLKKYNRESLYAYVNEQDEDKVTNLPALIGFVCNWVAKGKSLEMVIPKTNLEGLPLMDKKGNLEVKKNLPSVSIKDFPILFHKSGNS